MTAVAGLLGARTRRRLRAAPAQIAVVALVLTAWQAAVATDVLDERDVPAPNTVAAALVDLGGSPEFWSALGATLAGWSIGLTMAILIAVPIGLLLGCSEICYRSCRFTIDFLRTVPPVAIVPLALLLYGATLEMKLLLIVLGSVWPLLMQSMYGVQHIDPVTRETSRSYRLGRPLRVAFLILPGAAPFIGTGIRIAATMALLLTIGAELIGGAPGIGNSIGESQISADVPQLFALIFVSAALGIACNAALVRLERRVLRWHPAHRPVRAG